MKECSIFSAEYEGQRIYGVECGEVRIEVSVDFSKVKHIMEKCNFFGICPEHLADVVEDELYDDQSH